VANGVTEGLSFQIPRLTLFVASSVNKRIKFLSEIELEEGGRELSIEFASVDIQFHPLLNLRGGVVMNPIGAFNQNHDGPKWEFIDRPLSATEIIPSTWSNVGFGFFGKMARGEVTWAYEAYATNGFDERIISNSANRTRLAASKDNPERFGESFNGVPLYTLKTAVRDRRIGEAGVSYMGGVYNRFRDDGLGLDRPRHVDVVAIDFNASLRTPGTYITGEFAWNSVDVPGTYTQQFGNRQHGGFVDVIQPVWRGRFMDWNNSVLNLSVRAEYTDFNIGTFKETGGRIGDEVVSLTPGISFRPSLQTVLRFNYRYQWVTDILGNRNTRIGSILFGVSSYF
jgi:hypothetical protein